MPENYIVRAGDCVASVAFERGFFWETVWNFDGNSELKKTRKDPNVLLPGDELAIPDKTLGEDSGASEARHSFKRKGVPAQLRLRLVDFEDRPRKNLACDFDIDGHLVSKTTDGDGVVKVPMPPNAARIMLRFTVDNAPQEYELRAGHLDPVGADSGAGQRMINLGYDYLPDFEASSEKNRTAIRAFQRKADLEPTGEWNEATRAKLVELHGA